eukprot:m.16363 g.16363  ORF g.16363 m.16363 type:complete len:394 (+) comp6879_c0_seq1:1529-2710(+)
MGQNMSAGGAGFSPFYHGDDLNASTLAVGVNQWLSAELPGSPSPRSGHASAISEDGSCMWVYGGFWEDHQGENKVCFQELYRFHIPSRTWALIPTTGPAPDTPCSQSAVIVGHTLYVFGGTGVPFGQTNGHSMYLCNLRTFVWTVAENNPDDEPSPRFGQAMVNSKTGYLYLFGGTNFFSFTGDMYRFSLVTNKFERVTFTGDPPSPRYRHTMVQHGDSLLLFGGGSPFPSREEFEMTFFYRFHLATNVWTQEPLLPDEHFGFPLGRRSHSTVLLEHANLLVMGGLLDTVETTLDCWVLDLTTLRWSHRPSMSTWPAAAYFHSSEATPEGLVITFGGVLSDRTRTNHVCLFHTRVPPLSALCVEAVAQQRLFSRDQCAAGGVPEHLLRKIFPG